MNYFLPIHCGAPDYFKILNKKITRLNINHIIRNYSKVDLSLQINKFNYLTIGPYLAGLFEGDGHVILPKIYNSKLSYPSINITFVNKDLPLVCKLVELYGGRIRFKNKENAIIWILSKHADLLNIINILNGYLRTPKLIKFNELIKWLNENYNYDIKINSIDNSDLNTNGWLAGFIDAEGSFKIRYTKKRIDEKSNKVLTKERIELRFSLEQRKTLSNSDESYKEIMLKIHYFFGLLNELRTSTHNINKTYWIVEVTSLDRLNFIIEYFNIYPLLTAKRNDYEDWLKAYHMIKDKKHLTEIGKLKINNLKLNMNKNREEFNWTHLTYLNNVQ